MKLIRVLISVKASVITNSLACSFLILTAISLRSENFCLNTSSIFSLENTLIEETCFFPDYVESALYSTLIFDDSIPQLNLIFDSLSVTVTALSTTSPYVGMGVAFNLSEDENQQEVDTVQVKFRNVLFEKNAIVYQGTLSFVDDVDNYDLEKDQGALLDIIIFLDEPKYFGKIEEILINTFDRIQDISASYFAEESTLELIEKQAQVYSNWYNLKNKPNELTNLEADSLIQVMKSDLNEMKVIYNGLNYLLIRRFNTISQNALSELVEEEEQALLTSIPNDNTTREYSGSYILSNDTESYYIPGGKPRMTEYERRILSIARSYFGHETKELSKIEAYRKLQASLRSEYELLRLYRNFGIIGYSPDILALISLNSYSFQNNEACVLELKNLFKRLVNSSINSLRTQN